MTKTIKFAEIFRSVLCIIPCLLILGSCSDDNDEEGNNFEDLNGFWIGTYEIQQVGGCGLSDESTLNTLLEFEIINTGEVEIIEYSYVDSLDTYYYTDSLKYRWTGTINSAYNFVLEKPGFSTCLGVPREYIAQYEGTILSLDGNYLLNTDSDEIWCPNLNCIFNLEYDLVHIDSLTVNTAKYEELDDIIDIKSNTPFR